VGRVTYFLIISGRDNTKAINIFIVTLYFLSNVYSKIISDKANVTF